MPVFFRDDVRILFVHTPKCAGTYVEKLLEKNGFSMEYCDRGRNPGNLNQIRKCSPQHMHAEMLQTIFNLAHFDKIFMLARHPEARIISEFRMRHGAASSTSDIDGWIQRTLKKYTTNPFIYDNHIRPQNEFWVPGCKVFKLDGNLGATFGRQLSDFLQYPLDKLSMERVFDRLEIDGSSSEIGSISSESRRLIRTFYDEDYEKFGYVDDGESSLRISQY